MSNEAEPSGLDERVRRGFRWVSVAQLVAQLVWLLVTPLLARVLNASDYGLYNTATVALGFLGAISGLGITAAVIQRRELSREELQTAFWANLLAGGAIALVGVAVMPLLAYLYQEPRLLWVGMIQALTSFTSASITMALAIVSRELRFQAHVVITSVREILSASLTLALAWSGAGVWSLVLGPLLTHIPVTFVALRAAKFWPRWRLRWEELRKIRRFSLYYTGEVAANYLVNNLDYLAVGYVLGIEAHGLYTQAFLLTHFAYNQITPVVSRVLTAAFSRQQDDDDALARGYLQATRGLAVVTFPILVFFATATEWVVSGYLGPDWLEIVPYVRILAVVGALKCVVTCVGLIINAKGRADLGFRWNLLVLVLMAIAIGYGVRFGVEGVCWAWVSVFVPQAIAIQIITHRLIRLPNLRFLSELLAPFFFALALLGLLLTARALLLSWGFEAQHIGWILLVVWAPLYVLGVRGLCPELWAGILGRRRP